VETDAVAHWDRRLLADVLARMVEPRGGSGKALLLGDYLVALIEDDSQTGDRARAISKKQDVRFRSVNAEAIGSAGLGTRRESLSGTLLGLGDENSVLYINGVDH